MIFFFFFQTERNYSQRTIIHFLQEICVYISRNRVSNQDFLQFFSMDIECGLTWLIKRAVTEN